MRKHQKKLVSKIDRKGFTLIELLAVIIILGVLMIIAIPSVTEYISNSRKNAYITIATRYIDGVRNKVNGGSFSIYDKEITYYISGSCVSLERGGESPYGDFEDLYVVVTYNGSGYDYYFTSRDETNMGIYLTYQDLLNIDEIKSGVTSIRTDVGVGEREKILLLDNTCDVNTATEIVATSNILEKGKLDELEREESLVSQIVTVDDIPLDIEIDFGKVPSNTNGKGLYIRSGTENTANPIYYYRGEVYDNNVIFGNFCWKIVRTTETGGTKLIYSGIPNDGKCNNVATAATIGYSTFNSKSDDNAYVGYMYGTPSSSTYEETHANIHDSMIKAKIDNWYKNNMTSYTDYLEDTIWCNDRSIVPNPTDGYVGTGSGNTYTVYGAAGRYYDDLTPVVPDLTCKNSNDRFTVDSNNGNGALIYPVGLLTADEAVLAGSGWKIYSRSHYLYNEYDWWTMSPKIFYGEYNSTEENYIASPLTTTDAHSFSAGYSLSERNARNVITVRPAVSLKAGTKIASGDGTANNPYIVE